MNDRVEVLEWYAQCREKMASASEAIEDPIMRTIIVAQHRLVIAQVWALIATASQSR